MTTLTQFSPSRNQNFSFQATLDGQQYQVTLPWSLFGQRWYIEIYTLQNQLVMSKPLRASPDSSDINLVAGYFMASTLVYRASTNNFEVSP